MDSDIEDYVTQLLLRYFRAGREAGVQYPATRHAEDLEILRLHWSVSPPVTHLCEYALTHRHEAQASLDTRTRVDDISIRGRLDARKTILRRLTTGHPTLVVFHEPMKDYTEGPNRVLIWVMQHAYLLLHRFGALAHPESTYAARVRDAMVAVTRVRRMEPLARAITETDYMMRPPASSLAQAARSRSPLYRKAAAALRSLIEIESGKEEAVQTLLRSTLVGPLKRWQAFELATALAMAQALAQRLGTRLRIRNITPGSGTAIIEAGPYDLYWQNRTVSYVDPIPEPSETRVRQILEAYGISQGEDRPDVVVVERASGSVVALAEAKYFEGETDWPGAFRDATAQVVRYARGYPAVALDTLISRSLVALRSYPERRPPPVGAPVVVGFSDLRDGLESWANRFPVPNAA